MWLDTPQGADDSGASDSTQFAVAPVAHLVVISGQSTGLERRFPILPGKTRIGREVGSDVQLLEPAVSRRHAVVVWEGDAPFIEHLSSTNQTIVNSERVAGRRALRHGDTIDLAGQVALRVEFIDAPAIAGAAAAQASAPAPAPERPSATLRQKLEEQLRLEPEIQEQFLRTGAFLDVDVAGSYALEAGPPAAKIAVSFERWREFIMDRVRVRGAGGELLNSNGDEVMCMFSDAGSAVAGGIAILEELPEFNRTENLLSGPFRLRVGIHYGTCAVDVEQGRAYSQVLDVAGHLQKEAQIDGLLISQQMFEQLGDAAEFEPAGVLTREGI